MTTQADELAARIVLDADGYPTEDALTAIREWPCQFGWRPLMDAVGDVWAEYGRWDEYPGGADDHGRGVVRFSLSTGGWSGNESLICALRDNMVFWFMCWVSSRRGGHYVFETLRK